ncbi:RHS repeat domain-containing protein [Pseudidiomarina aquimaris]|uniref:RHS repeat domain-containing protein n=1 Tax=Pseudidiomarina aquimaris TaxID=641841 RepID=UPI001300AB30|nr:RHS repeat-associated core domain-containing protein [Pseudidiomarina aquimaris]
MPSQQSRAGHEVVFHYDTYGREVGKTITIDGDVYQVATEYDSRLGRVKARMLASGIKLAYANDSRGYLLHLRNAQSDFSYQDVESHDALGNITLQRYNSGTLTASASYSASGQMQSIVASSALAGAVHELNYSYGDFDNLSQQQVVYAYGMKQSTESYSYDSLQRLVSATRVFSNEPVPDTTVNYAYDAAGNLLEKSDYATALYYGTSNGGAANSNAGPHAVSRAVLLDGSTRTYNYDAAGQRISGNGVTLSYTASGKPKRISTGSGVVEFFYAANGERYKKVSTTGGSTRTTHYVDGDVEVELTSTGTVTRTDIAGVALVRRSETANTSSHSLRYVLRDRLGSVVTLTDALNQVQEHRSFDAFGKPRYGGMVEGNGTLTSLTQGAPFTPRGFTGHEHIDSAKLIHMNGRGYDYQLGRFLSVDPFIQAPANSQSHNPYSYIMNNPLAGTDPSGYLWCGTGALGKAECNDERKHKRRDFGSVGFRAVETYWVHRGSAASNGARHSPRSAATGERERGAIGGPGEGGSSGGGTSSGCQTSIDCQGNGNGYDKSDTYYHEYTMFHNICSTDVSSCTVENVYNSLTKNAAPGADGTNAVSADKVTEIQMAGVSGGHVSHIADVDNYRVVNITHDDHIFYNGIVIRSVVQNDGVISIRSYGEGVNRTNWTYMPDRVSWAANYILAKPGFKQQDNNIRRQVLSLSSDGRGVLRREAQFRQQLRSDLMKGPKY